MRLFRTTFRDRDGKKRKARASGGKKFKELDATERNHPVEKVGRKIRRLMPFIDAKEV